MAGIFSGKSVGAKTKSKVKVENKLLEEERMQKLKVLMDHKEIVKKLVSEKTLFFQNLILEGNAISDKFVQFRVWRNRYNNSNSGNPNTFLMAFTELDRRIQLLSHIFMAFDVKLVQSSQVLHEYLRFMDCQFTWIQENIRFASMAVSMKQMKAVWTPSDAWVKSFPDLKLEDLGEDWKHLQLEEKLTQCFRQMQAVIRFIASNGDL